MKGFKQCDQGHFYNDSLSECNYCPKNNSAGSESKTEQLSGVSNTDHTVEASSDKTQVFGGGSSSSSSKSNNETFDPNKTTIGRPASDNESSKSNTSQRRKLRGWFVSFDIEEFGMDYRIIEGRNTVGSNPSNDVTVQDAEVSGMHALILCKKDKFIITDELSSNGTLLNGEDLSPREPFSLNDGDEVRIGTTNLLFKTAFKK
jgi:hypothetical protein